MMRMPTATYRLQLTPEFGFESARALFPTLVRLGVSHVYLSPICEAVSGSQHGYDVVDHTQIRAEFGGVDGLEALLDGATEHGLGVIIDHVPNHVSVAQPHENPTWWKMLTEGPTSDAANFFDVDWPAGGGKVIVPQLGRPLDDLLSDGAVDVRPNGDGVVGDGELVIGTQRFPLAPGTAHLPVEEAVGRQHYRLQYWRDPARNVRRFFTIDDLVAVRVEHPDVAEHVDTWPQRLLAHEAFAGVRVDHVDGLADPTGYLEQLRGLLGDRLLLVEKILAPGEWLPEAWDVDGTTGYEHITMTEHTLLDPTARETLSRMWAQITDDTPFLDLERIGRAEVLDGGLLPDLERTLRVVIDAEPDDVPADVAADDPAGVESPITREALTRLTLEFDRYRTYLPDPASRPAFDDLVDATLQRVDHDELSDQLRDQLHDEIVRVARVLTQDPKSRTRWQQLTGPVMAKGAEDRAFYRHFPLASLCEVGGTPGEFDTSIDEFHRYQTERGARCATGMLASTTHDTKRSAGVRARSLALAARAPAWDEVVSAWSTEHEGLLGDLDRRFVSLALQTAVTARPLTIERLHDYLVKAAREGDEITSWIEPDEHVEAQLGLLAEAAINSSAINSSATDEAGAAASMGLAAFAAEIEPAGDAIGLRLLALQLTCPGFPDLYQGAPMTLLSLVDPDNRVPPAWEQLDRLIDAVPTTDTEMAFSLGSADLARTTMTERILRLRARRPESFDERSGYTALEVSGTDAAHLIAYSRTSGGEIPSLVVIVSRARADAIDGAGTSVELPDGTWRSILHDDALLANGGTTRVADLMGAAEVAVLERTDR